MLIPIGLECIQRALKSYFNIYCEYFRPQDRIKHYIFSNIQEYVVQFVKSQIWVSIQYLVTLERRGLRPALASLPQDLFFSEFARSSLGHCVRPPSLYWVQTANDAQCTSFSSKCSNIIPAKFVRNVKTT